MLPYVEVASLPPSASFYSAVTHPLGLKYISASPGAIVFGAPSPTDPSTANPVFEVRSVADRTAAPRYQRLVLSAASPSVVQNFRAAALRAAPELLLIGGAEDGSQRHPDADPSSAFTTSGDSRAQIRDLDDNIMEVVFSPDHAGSTVRRTTTEESSHILSWNPDVALASSSRSIAPGAAGGAVEPPYVLRRSVTTSVIESTPSVASSSSPSSPPAAADKKSSSGLIGTVLGAVAAGAAIGGAVTYMNMKGQREKAPRQEFDAPPFHRRSTYPEPAPDHMHVQPRYVERTVEKVYYADQLPPGKSRHYPPPTYMARYSQVGDRGREVEELDDRSSRYTAQQSTTGRSRTKSEAGSMRQPLMIADAEYRSNAGSRYTTATAPKMLMDHSYASSRHSSNMLPEADLWSRTSSRQSTPRSIRQPEVETYVSARTQSHAPTYVSSRSKSYTPDAETYVSSRSKRSERSESTIRPTATRHSTYDGSIVYGDMPIRSAAPSRAPSQAHSAATQSRHSTAARSSATASKMMMTPAASAAGASRATARQVPLPESRVSYTSARAVPLPRSHANYDDNNDDDNDSIAPSDSISCIGINPRSQRA
ncbi:hypothetical protein PFICI_03516 [Pestalotiopsis fici W106-1]|uniref:Uncharacterized protein n=1 Tax=Pestalotiopsis fici (strain W106-1 / CGMCC3.15140) TaxID=1229662 RepID=W3XJQ7_PESFW|nr:uncharacterized protein PFICI_03516 [Pestalotiopsis fici W106-1]ETS85491.1 hypothetical protein PFICI_03516 [Pestalotiopsis fici W106-1]